VIRISVSDLETWRYWSANEDSTMDELLARLRHEEPPTPAMEAGRAFAKLMEHAKPGALDVETVDGWTFDFTLLDGASFALPTVREIKAEVPFVTPSGPVTLVGMVDQLDGLIVHDEKLTERWDAERYFDSMQWRAYLVMFGARAFVYDVFQCRRNEDDRHVTITDYQAITFYDYPAIRADVQDAVNELAAVIVRYLPDRVTRMASCGHPLHPRGFGCTHDGCANDSRQFATSEATR